MDPSLHLPKENPHFSLFMFTRKAVFEFDKTEDTDLEELELELIDAGLEELEENEGVIYAYADYTNFGTLSEAIENLGLELKRSSLKRFPTTPIDFSEDQYGLHHL